jgi:hypothetical protein
MCARCARLAVERTYGVNLVGQKTASQTGFAGPSVLSHKLLTEFRRHSGQAGDSWRDPESRKLKEKIWIPACAGMTKSKTCEVLKNFWDMILARCHQGILCADCAR